MAASIFGRLLPGFFQSSPVHDSFRRSRMPTVERFYGTTFSYRNVDLVPLYDRERIVSLSGSSLFPRLAKSTTPKTGFVSPKLLSLVDFCYSYSTRSGVSARSSRASSSGMCELEKKPEPNSNPAMAPAPSRGVIRICQRKNADAQREA